MLTRMRLTERYLKACETFGRWRSEEGQGLTEYAFIGSLVALILIVAVTALGARTLQLWTDVQHSMP